MMFAGTKRTVLVIEDNELNREILCEILSEKYHVIEAENGKVGLELLSENESVISLILLDIQMPVMNGYEFLDAVRVRPSFAKIPIIVTTSSASFGDEIKCLENGASDFITKPYNTDIVLRRVSSMIRLSEASAVLSKMEKDSLTGLYSKEYFYVLAERELEYNTDTRYDMVCTDIKSFKILNERYGSKRGDQLLIRVAQAVEQLFPQKSLCGRISGDIFAVLMPHQEDDFFCDIVDKLVLVRKSSPMPNAVLNIGIYKNVDHKLPVSVICDNAMLAIETIKGQYGRLFAEFDDGVKQRFLREQIIVDSMDEALEQNQFEVYYQPKHDLQKEIHGGAEALIRWTHPEFGFMNPGEFIPLFEKNGFISRLDHYVRERVAADLHEWITKGGPVVPISINVSRADFDGTDLVDDVIMLADKYKLPRSLIHLEVTESTYTDDPERIFAAVRALREAGFSIELDDFGSGYSSLNVLNDLEMDVLKLDMSLVRSMDSEKQKLILEHIFALAKSLSMEVVAEGVETQKQADELRSMGCTYAQGYFYSKPLPKHEFEEYLRK